MVVTINEKHDNLKLGIIGTRASCFQKVLDQYNMKYVLLNSIEDVDETYDFVFESGLYTIIPENILSKPKYGFVGTHETPLPEGRGHAPIQWTVLNNRKNLVVSLYKLNKGTDTGQIICQQNVHILETDGLHEMNKKREQGIEQAFSVFISELKDGFLVLRQQSGKGSYNKKRKPKDSELDIEQPLSRLWNKIRICDNDKFPAWFSVGSKKVILKYYIEEKE